MSELDLTDYVDLAARTWVVEHTTLNWDKLPDATQHAYREAVLPVVSVVIAEYKKNHAFEDMTFLGGIG